MQKSDLSVFDPKNLRLTGESDLYIGPVHQDTSGMQMSFEFDKDIYHCQGLLFLSTAFVRYLLKEKGSDIFAREEGTRFTTILTCNITQQQKIRELVTTAIKDAEQYVRRVTSEERTELTEILQRVKIEVLERRGDEMLIILKIFSQAGPAGLIKIPLAWRD